MPKSFYKNIILEISPGVYEPREDSFLLAQVLEKVLETKKFRRVLDMGCGSGLLAIIAAKQGCEVVAVDIDVRALECAGKNAAANSTKINFSASDLFSNVSGKFDVIVFNPPYLPEEISDFSRAWAAGKNCGLVLEAIGQAGDFLEPDGKLLMVVSSLTRIENVMKKLKGCGFSASAISEKKIPWETLFVICAKKQFYK